LDLSLLIILKTFCAATLVTFAGGRLLSLRTYWRDRDHQNGSNQPQVHEYLLGYAACDDDA
jgi:hypothetical protein